MEVISLLYILAAIVGGIVIGVCAALFVINNEETEQNWHNCLPSCKCKDANKCETWCQAKQRFYENPPED